VHLSVGKQAILFTDIVGSSEVYLQNGDPKAFAQIKKHFDEIYPIVAANDGAIVKTMGDSVMSAFSDTLDAVKAAKSLQECFSEDHDELSLRLRTTLNVGPCIAVNLDSNIDYFGRTVNEAAKLQDFAKSGQIVFTDAVWQESGVEQYCKNYCAAVDSLDGKYVVSLNS
jgi:class 3 adenylate cyclase